MLYKIFKYIFCKLGDLKRIKMSWHVYLAGEIHSQWREDVRNLTLEAKLPIVFDSPVTDHSASDDCGAEILGQESEKFWHDHKGAKLNGMRTRKLISRADIVVVRFGEKYKQWNAAFDAGYATALGKSVVVMHGQEFQHALKEVDALAMAVVKDTTQLVKVFEYVITGRL